MTKRGRARSRHDNENATVAPKPRGTVPPSESGVKYLRGPVLTAMCVLLAGSVAFAFNTVPLAGILRQEFSTSDYIEANYVAPTADNMKMPAKKRNLIHIYMESVENSYYSKDLGGYMDVNLMPELAKLSDTGVSFSNTDKHGGPQQLYASGHSIAAMVNMWAGTPMLAAGAGDGTQMSYPDFTTTGDILHKAGYATEFMLGANGKWGGLGDYYRRHGDFLVFDHPYAISKGLIPPDYHEWWGFEDDKLYEYAKTDLTRLGQDSKPFYFVLENADTHFPDGYASKRMTERPFEKHYANVIKYSQEETVKLIKWIQAQPWADDTTIVVTGDHRSMDKNFFHGWDKDYNRTVVNFILNPVQGTDQPDSVTKNRQYAPFDLFPTILSSIGVEIKGDRLGLGTNLFSGKKTLVERDGVEKINDEFSRASAFYDSHRETKATNQDIRQDRK
nr:LTA synthase family protein [Corynebacterium lactis]